MSFLTNLLDKLLAADNYSTQAIFIDVRTAQEQTKGIIKGALCIPLSTLTDTITQAVADKDQPIVVYCASGIRSLRAKKQLQKMGYTQVSNGINSKKIKDKTGLALVKPH